MNIKQFIQKEKEESIQLIKEDIQEGYHRDTDLNEFVNEINSELEIIIFNNIKDKIRFDLVNNFDGNFYKSMLGKGEQIEYSDLYEILKRLYVYHHKDNTFTLNFQDYSIHIDFDLSEKFNPAQIILKAIGTDWYLKASDLK